MQSLRSANAFVNKCNFWVDRSTALVIFSVNFLSMNPSAVVIFVQVGYIFFLHHASMFSKYYSPTNCNMRIVFLIGKPNSGKTTHARRLAEEHAENIRVVSTGDWLREMKNRENSDLGQFIFHNWSHEALMPLVIEFLDRKLGDYATYDDRLTIVVDGFPRTVSEASSIARIARGHPVRVIELCMDDDVLMQRSSERRGRVEDDTETAMTIRLDSYTYTIDAIRNELNYGNVDLVQVNDPNADLWPLVEQTTRRLVIPAREIRHTLCRKAFIEAGPMDRAEVIQMSLRLAHSTNMRQKFFGTHPISLTREDLHRIRRHPYLVSLKAIGMRYMCLVHEKCMWLISRSLRVYVGLRNDRLGPFEGTLLDGELMGEEEASKYLVLDCLATQNVSCTTKPIIERMRRAHTCRRV